MSNLYDRLTTVVRDLRATIDNHPDAAEDDAFEPVFTELDDIMDDVQSMESRVECLEDEIDDVRDELDEAQMVASSWEDWVDHCVEVIPSNSSLGDAIKIRETLEKVIKEL